MLATSGTRSGKERREGLAFRLVEAFALRHHVRFRMAELRWRALLRQRGMLLLQVSVELSYGTLCHPAFLDGLV